MNNKTQNLRESPESRVWKVEGNLHSPTWIKKMELAERSNFNKVLRNTDIKKEINGFFGYRLSIQLRYHSNKVAVYYVSCLDCVHNVTDGYPIIQYGNEIRFIAGNNDPARAIEEVGLDNFNITEEEKRELRGLISGLLIRTTDF